MRGSRRGISLVEGVISMAIVAGLGVAVMNVIGASAVDSAKTERDAIAAILAHSLLAEIMATTDIGDGHSDGGGERTDYINVWEFDTWASMPPEYPHGVEMPGRVDWGREIQVEWVRPASQKTVSEDDTGLILITVTVSYKKEPVHTLQALRQGSDALRAARDAAR